MKILMIAPTPFFADRGCHVRILGEINALQAQGHRVMLTTYHIGRDVEDLNISRIISIPWYKKLEAGSSWHKFYLDVLLLIKTLRVCRREKPDIIHGHLHEGAVIGKITSAVLSMGRTPVIFDVQGSLTEELVTYGFFKNLKPLKIVFRYIEKMICKLPDFFICSSYSNEQFIKIDMNVPESKVAPILDGIYPDFFSCNQNGTLKKQLNIPDKKKLLYIPDH